MKKATLRIAGKFLIAIGVVLWNFKTNWAFNLHQKLGKIVANLDRKHNLDLWDENSSGKDSNRF